jgi:hypothetical protein
MKIRSKVEEFVVDVHPLSQSAGHVMDGGDCGYCCVAGIFNLPSIINAYEFVEKRMKNGWERRQNMHAWRWEQLLKSLNLPNKEFRVHFNRYKTGVIPVPWHNINWSHKVRNIIKSGNVLISSIRFNKSVPIAPESCGESDHNIIINGWKFEWVDNPRFPGAKDGISSVRISCSVNGTYWIEWSNLLYWHGCYPSFVINVDNARKSILV